MPTLAVTNFNIVCSVLGGFITLFGLVSYLFKEKFYLSEALISLVAGIIFSPHATNLVKPLEYAGSQANLDAITLYFSRLVLGVQLVLAGVQLPSRYLQKEWKSLALLLGPVMTVMWICSSLIVWGMVPDLPLLHALAIGACVTPTDPVLSNSIVKGKFADSNVPKDLQKIIIAESGANDGLGYPFLFIALYLIKYLGAGQSGDASTAIGLWFVETWIYTILLSIIYGFVVGWVAKELLHWAEERKFVDRESFLVFAITLALFIVGTCGIIGSDDVLACFIAGNAFTWDDWFRLETLDDSLQPTIDMLLNLSVFMWLGAVCPWSSFLSSMDVIPIYRLILLGLLILIFRRLPVVFALHRFIRQIEEKRQAIFVGFFGPIGVSAIFYLYISLEFLETIELDGSQRPDAKRLGDTLRVVVWFLAICSIVAIGSLSIESVSNYGHESRELTGKLWCLNPSRILIFSYLFAISLFCRLLPAASVAVIIVKMPISKRSIPRLIPIILQVVHGLSIPLGKLGFYLPRTLSHAFDSSASEDPQPFRLRDRAEVSPNVLRERRRLTSTSGHSTPSLFAAPTDSPIFRIGGTVIQDRQSGTATLAGDGDQPPTHSPTPNRTIRFPDEAHNSVGGQQEV